jgi:hypothetical protein
VPGSSLLGGPADASSSTFISGFVFLTYKILSDHQQAKKSFPRSAVWGEAPPSTAVYSGLRNK